MYYHARIVAVEQSTPSGAFREAVQRAAASALAAPHISEVERQRMRDLRRATGPYQFRALDMLMDLLARIPDEAPELAFLADIRTAIDARRARNEHRALSDALTVECECEADAMPLHLAVAMNEGDVDALDAALAATIRERVAADELVMALSEKRFALLHGGGK